MSSGDVGLYPAVTVSGEDNMRAVQEARDNLERKVQCDNVLVGPCDSKTRLLKLMNGGSFGQIFLGENVSTSEKVAVKIEHPGQIEQLLYEGQVYRKLKGGPGIPSVAWYGMHGSAFNVLVMDLLGPSLQDLLHDAGHKFSLKTVLLLIDQMLDTIQFVHEQNFVHRDLSSNNFMLGSGDNAHKLYLIDYGLTKKLESGRGFAGGKGVMRFRFARPMVGTARFCSIFCQRGEEEGRRDDMESLGYLWVYLLKGQLPWQGLQANSHAEKMEKILATKLATSLTTFCEGLPEEFLTYLTFVREMSQYAVPDYTAIKIMFHNLAKREGIEYDFLYDWSPISSACQSRGRLLNGEADGSEPTQESEDPNIQYLGSSRTISTSSSAPSDGACSH